jgi:hypothetical protein
MGVKIVDQYSLLHFSTGCIAYFFGIKFINWIILHTIFEIIENSSQGIYFIDNYLKFWPGGKKAPDNLKNSISDLIFTIIGYIMAYKLDMFYKQK